MRKWREMKFGKIDSRLPWWDKIWNVKVENEGHLTKKLSSVQDWVIFVLTGLIKEKDILITYLLIYTEFKLILAYLSIISCNASLQLT